VSSVRSPRNSSLSLATRCLIFELPELTASNPQLLPAFR
jgi:hypothetical protein